MTEQTPTVDELAADAQRDAELAQLRDDVYAQRDAELAQLRDDVDAANARAEAAEKAAATTGETAPRYAAYDNTYEKFLPGVHNTRKDASAAAKAAGVKDFTVREV